MDRPRNMARPIDYDFYKARAHELRRQQIARLLDGLVAWLRAPVKPRAHAPRTTALGPRASRC